MSDVGLHPSEPRSSPPAVKREPQEYREYSEHQGQPEASVVALNPSAVLFEALAEEIAGQAVGWSSSALLRLEQQLLERYGHELGGEHPVRRLVRLAARPARGPVR
jgi:hypothetical protein